MRPLLLALCSLLVVVPTASARTVSRCDGARIAGGVARSVTDCTPVSLAAGPTAAAREAVGRVAGALRVSPGELSPVAVTHTAAGSRVRFQQVVDGVPVHDGQVAVALAPDGSVQQIVNSASPDASVDPRPRVSRGAAVLTARRRVPSGFDLAAPATASLVAEPRGGALELAWLIVLPVADPRGDWNVLVSARSGEMLDAYDAMKGDEGTMRTYVPNPIQKTGNTALRENVAPRPGTDAFTDVTLFDLDPGTTKLIGPFADLSAPGVTGCPNPYVPGSATNAHRMYSYVPSNPRFEETVAYAAIDEVMSTLPVPVSLDGPLAVDVHCFDDDNSRYSPAQHALLFGDGGVNDAADADVVAHELGHAVQDAQVPGFGPGTSTEQAAIGEGFGDVLAAYTYLDVGNPTYQQANRFCVMEWDATGQSPAGGPLKCKRRVDGIDESTGADIGTYRGTPDESHRDGRYWSAMMTCVFTGMEQRLQSTDAARDRILTLAIAQTSHLTPTAENGAFADSVTALRTEDVARYNGEDVALINDCARRRLGFAAARDFTAPEVQGTLAPAAPDGANGWYRTAPAVQWTVRDPESPQIVRSGCQAGTDPADTQRKTITCTASSRGGVTTKTLAYRKDGKPPSVIARLSLASPRVGQHLDVAVNAVDGVSGVAGRSCATPSTAHTGPHTVRCTATDFAGNVGAATVSYTVGPRQRFTAKRARVARNGNVSFRLRSNGGGRVTVTATARGVRFATQTAALTADHAKRVVLRPVKKARKAARRLRGGRRVTVKVTVTPELGGRKGRLTLRVRR